MTNFNGVILVKKLKHYSKTVSDKIRGLIMV